ncbi:MAG: heme exporter protein CcmD [Deltaproteobacteria bacterium]|nr:heme exporter protein CcmD [Deltaproteobacteria bacterium]MBW2445741.1 heme exporter protein CcmD [Deltaproteobacteria bacterium]
MNYVIASYAIVLVSLIGYGASQLRARGRLRKALRDGRNRDRS